MEGTKPRTVSSLGMFDLLKGIGMLAIVFAHTAELYPLGTNDVTPFAFALFAYREALMAAFFIASGYGFRKRSIHKCIEQQLKTLLKPYLYTRTGHHGAPRFHSPRSFRLVGCRHLRIGQGLRRFPVGPAPHGHLLRASVFLLRPHVVLSGPDAGVGASGRAARDLPRAVHNPRSRRRHPAWLGRRRWCGSCLLASAQGMVSLPILHRYLAKSVH